MNTNEHYQQFQKWVQERILKRDDEGLMLRREIIDRLNDSPKCTRLLELLRQLYVREAARTWAACLRTADQTESGRAMALAYQDAANKIDQILREHDGRHTK